MGLEEKQRGIAPRNHVGVRLRSGVSNNGNYSCLVNYNGNNNWNNVSVTSGGIERLRYDVNWGDAFTFTVSVSQASSQYAPRLYLDSTAWESLGEGYLPPIKEDGPNGTKLYTYTIPKVTADSKLYLVSLDINIYAINFNPGKGVTFFDEVGNELNVYTGDIRVQHGKTLSFRADVADAYNKSVPQIVYNVNGEQKTLDFADGFYKATILGDGTIDCADLPLNKYDMKFATGEGYSFIGDASAEHGGTYVFTLKLDVGYTQSASSLAVMAALSQGGGAVTVYSVSQSGEDTLSFRVMDVRGDLDFTVTGVKLNNYNVTLTQSPLGTYTLYGDTFATHGKDFEFHIIFDDAYNESKPVFGVSPAHSVEFVREDAAAQTYYYRIKNVTSGIVVTVSGVERNKFDVTFDFGYDNLTEQVKLPYGSTVPKRDIPIRLGYIFLGWFENFDDDVAYDFSEQVHSDFTLYAKWEAINVTFTFMDGGNIHSTYTGVYAALSSPRRYPRLAYQKPVIFSKDGARFRDPPSFTALRRCHPRI